MKMKEIYLPKNEHTRTQKLNIYVHYIGFNNSEKLKKLKKLRKKKTIIFSVEMNNK